MTDEQANIAVAEACGATDRWVIMKLGLYYRPNAQGYTNCVNEAWIVSEAEADRYTYPHDTPVTKHRVPVQDYGKDLNAMHEAEKVLTNGQRRFYVHMLIKVHPLHYDPQSPTHLDDRMAVFMIVNMTAAQRREAFLRTLGKWTETA